MIIDQWVNLRNCLFILFTNVIQIKYCYHESHISLKLTPDYTLLAIRDSRFVIIRRKFVFTSANPPHYSQFIILLRIDLRFPWISRNRIRSAWWISANHGCEFDEFSLHTVRELHLNSRIKSTASLIIRGRFASTSEISKRMIRFTSVDEVSVFATYFRRCQRLCKCVTRNYIACNRL